MAKVRIEAERLSWEAPMANRVTDVAVAIRESMEELGWTFQRERSERMYSRFAVVLPLPKVAYVFRFRVTDPLEDVLVDTWEMRLTHRGDISWMAVGDYRYGDLAEIHRFLGELVERLPRRPWDFPWRQRFEAGLVIPEWSLGRQMWQRMRFDVGKRTPRDWIPRGSLGDRMREELGEEGEEERPGPNGSVGDEEDQG